MIIDYININIISIITTLFDIYNMFKVLVEPVKLLVDMFKQ